MKIELTAEDRALDVRKEYEDTRITIELLKWLGMYDALQSPPVTALPEATAPPVDEK